MADTIRVVVTGAAGQIGYSLLYPIAKGDVFGSTQKVVLVLLDIAPMLGTLKGVAMELQDCALSLLADTVATADADEAFKDADVAILVGAMPRRDGMERKDLLNANVKIFKAQGQSIDKVAKKTIKIVVVGNPANTNALICSKYAPSIPASSFTCLTRLDQNRAQAQISAKLGIACDKVYNTIIWGNHSSTQFPDVRSAKANVNGQEVSVFEAVKDDAWLKGDFISTVQKRGAAVIAARKLSSAMSAAKAICDHMRDWWFGTSGNRYVSMGVISNGEYGIEKGLMYSYPVTIKDGKWAIVENLDIDDFAREKMDATAKELSEENALALETCSD